MSAAGSKKSLPSLRTSKRLAAGPFSSAWNSEVGPTTVNTAANYQFYLASRTYAEKNPEILRIVLDEVAKVDDWGRNNPDEVATILSVSMMLRYSFNQQAAADAIEQAVSLVLDQGLRTGDIWSSGCTKVGTQEMGDAVVAALQNL